MFTNSLEDHWAVSIILSSYVLDEKKKTNSDKMIKNVI